MEFSRNIDAFGFQDLSEQEQLEIDAGNPILVAAEIYGVYSLMKHVAYEIGYLIGRANG